MTSPTHPLELWLALAVLAIGPLYAAIVVTLRHAIRIDAFLDVTERLLRAGDAERLEKLLQVVAGSHRGSPAVALVLLAWNKRFEVLDEPPPSAPRGYRVLGEPAGPTYPDRLRARLADDATRLRRRALRSGLPALTGLVSPAIVPLLASPPPEQAWWVAGGTALVSLATLRHAYTNARQIELVLARWPALIDPNRDLDDGR